MAGYTAYNWDVVNLPHKRFNYGIVHIRLTADGTVAGNRRRNIATFLVTPDANDSIAAGTTGGANRNFEGYHKRIDGVCTDDTSYVSAGQGRIVHCYINNVPSTAVLRIRWTNPPPVCSPFCMFSVFKLQDVVCNYQLWEV